MWYLQPRVALSILERVFDLSWDVWYIWGCDTWGYKLFSKWDRMAFLQGWVGIGNDLHVCCEALGTSKYSSSNTLSISTTWIGHTEFNFQMKHLQAHTFLLKQVCLCTLVGARDANTFCNHAAQYRLHTTAPAVHLWVPFGKAGRCECTRPVHKESSMRASVRSVPKGTEHSWVSGNTCADLNGSSCSQTLTLWCTFSFDNCFMTCISLFSFLMLN